MNLTDIQRIKAEREISLRETATHFLPATVSYMAVLKEVYGFGTIPKSEYDNALAIVGGAGYSFAVIYR